MEIVGLDAFTPEQVKFEVQAGARFVVFQYCISVLVMSFKRGSRIHFIRPGESAFTKGLPFCLCSLTLGWWGIPWGPIWTISTLATNLRGGRDVTAAVVQSITATPHAP